MYVNLGLVKTVFTCICFKAVSFCLDTLVQYSNYKGFPQEYIMPTDQHIPIISLKYKYKKGRNIYVCLYISLTWEVWSPKLSVVFVWPFWFRNSFLKINT